MEQKNFSAVVSTTISRQISFSFMAFFKNALKCDQITSEIKR
jgi:hypothetical protein